MEIIKKAAAIIISDRKLLVERSKGKEYFIAPGGTVEPNETYEEALVRELKEEFTIIVNESGFNKWGEFSAPAAGQEHRTVNMQVFLVSHYEGKIIGDSEVEEIKWITSSDVGKVKLGSIFEHEVLPRLKTQGLID